MGKVVLGTLFLVLLAAPAPGVGQGRPGATENPEIIKGRAVALDGDTLLIGGQRVRLFGVDAPDMRAWPWGAYARAALDSLLQCARPCVRGWQGPAGPTPLQANPARARLGEASRGAWVTCEVLDHDRRSRPVAVCGTADVPDLGRALIATGRAVPYRLYTYGPKAPARGVGRLGVGPAGQANPGPSGHANQDLAAAYDAAEAAARRARRGLWKDFAK